MFNIFSFSFIVTASNMVSFISFQMIKRDNIEENVYILIAGILPDKKDFDR